MTWTNVRAYGHHLRHKKKPINLMTGHIPLEGINPCQIRLTILFLLYHNQVYIIHGIQS